MTCNEVAEEAVARVPKACTCTRLWLEAGPAVLDAVLGDADTYSVVSGVLNTGFRA